MTQPQIDKSIYNEVLGLAVNLAVVAGNITVILAAVLAIQVLAADIPIIRAQTDALPVLTETGGIVTTTVLNTEYNLYINNAPAGVFKPICLKVDFTAQTAGETVEIKTYYRIALGGGMILQDPVLTFAGLVSPELRNINLEPNRYGIQVTIERTGGGAIAYPWEVFYED